MKQYELEHPRHVPDHPWWPHAKIGDQAMPLAPPLVGDGQPFLPIVHYSKRGDQLKVFWGPEESYASEGSVVVTVLRAHACSDLVQGVKIWGLSAIVPIEDCPIPTQHPVPSVDPLIFKPFAHYDQVTGILLIRWLPGANVVEQVETENIGHPMTMLLAADPQPEDQPGQKPWLLVSIAIRDFGQPQEFSKIRVPLQANSPATPSAPS